MKMYLITIGIILIAPLFFSGRLRLVVGEKGCALKDIYLISVSGWLFFLMACRDFKVGRDLANYIPMFRRYGRAPLENLYRQSLGRDQNIEYGYVLFNKFLYEINKDPRFLLVVMAGIMILAMALGIKKESLDVEFSFFVYVTMGPFIDSLSGLRQGASASLGVLAYHFIKKRNLRSFLIVVAVAAIIHKSALILLPLYFLYGFKLNYKTLALFAVSYFVCAFFGGYILERIIKLTGYVRYLRYIGEGASGASVGLAVLYTALIVIFSFFLYGNYDKDISFDLFILLFAGNFVVLTFWLGIVARIIKYFLFLSVLAIPNLNYRIAKESNRLFVKICIEIVFVLYFVLVLCRSNNSGALPYLFFWE